MLLKEALGVPIIIGGPHATTLPELTLQNPHIDFLVYGEGEYVFRDWLRQIEAGDTNWGQNIGLWYKDADGNVVNGGERELIPDLDELPFPARHLFDLKAYPLYAPERRADAHGAHQPRLPVQMLVLLQGHRRAAPIASAARRTSWPSCASSSTRYDVRNFYFMDDLFTINVKRLEAILDYFIAQDLGRALALPGPCRSGQPRTAGEDVQGRLPPDSLRHRVGQPGNPEEDRQAHRPRSGAPGRRSGPRTPAS